MKKSIVIFFLLASNVICAQTKHTNKIISKSKQLIQVIFETKDSAMLEDLFAPLMIHQAGNGKVEQRQEAISHIVNNPASYLQADMTKGYGVSKSMDSTLVKYFFKGKEVKPSASAEIYTVNLTMVWHKVKKDYKLFRLETLRIE
ncbi:MAG TPA: hypothetical protein PKC82_07180 [Chitinophagaceae bacterium]|jgi:hypothetical protein|nr:hypothetical protein [Chitinophagaceae bacterium]HMW66695.1 hypothetical protein [Chitinophagaceae bacterium]HNA19546.1 hypothetical protein [Chitinophagaceae bacterium]HNJ55586.1 hypothetical protein [Chitinophagaceae bacterium]HNO00466.1 hypothetical protein [Chitinophagaceae bacterium]